jgi:hypothetical protein
MQRPSFARVQPLSVEHLAAGESATEFQPGDFILTHGDSFFSHLIRFGQQLRVHGDDRPYTYWNHAALISTTDGGLIEARGDGVKRTKLSDYTPKDYQLVHIDATDADRKEAVTFAEWAADTRCKYGRLTIASIALSVLTGCKLAFFVDGEFICSGLVARALERTTAVFSLDPVHIAPADLAKYYGVPGPGEAPVRQPLEASPRQPGFRP